ncbi:MAG: DUF2946 family protein [Methylotenera sp.]
MKRLICLFLMLWLPLFMASAWAMNMQMQLDSTAHDVVIMHMSCHDDTNQAQGNQTHKTHQCFACGICALANASASFSTAPFFNLATKPSSAPLPANVVFSSQDYPPAYKPPILN